MPADIALLRSSASLCCQQIIFEKGRGLRSLQLELHVEYETDNDKNICVMRNVQ